MRNPTKLLALAERCEEVRLTRAQAIRHGIAPKPVHRAAKITADGRVSAKCFNKPRAINLAAANWTIRDDAVTCQKCLRAIAAGRHLDGVLHDAMLGGRWDPQYLRVRFDGQKHASNVHPTWRVDYAHGDAMLGVE